MSRNGSSPPFQHRAVMVKASRAFCNGGETGDIPILEFAKSRHVEIEIVVGLVEFWWKHAWARSVFYLFPRSGAPNPDVSWPLILCFDPATYAVSRYFSPPVLRCHPGQGYGANNSLSMARYREKNTTHSEDSIFGIQSYFRAQTVALDANWLASTQPQQPTASVVPWRHRGLSSQPHSGSTLHASAPTLRTRWPVSIARKASPCRQTS